jgi:hypothetical protein
MDTAGRFFVNRGLANGEIAMNIRASGRSALIIAAGLWLGFAGPLHTADAAAATSDQAAATGEASGPPVKLSKFTKHRSHHASRHVAHRKSAKVASKTKTDNTVAADKTAANAAPAPQDSDKQPPLPPTVANSNAQMPGMSTTDAAAAAPPTEAAALASTAGNTLAARQNDPSSQPQVPAETDAAAAANVVPSDELNDVDRALSEQQPAAPTLALASVDAPASTTPAATDASVTTGQAASNEDSAWNQTSLIGKIFIAFGGLLTLASAARMFMA